MSANAHPPLPSRAEVTAVIQRESSKGLKTVSLVLAAIGVLIFVIGAVTGERRAWEAWHVNWLYFTCISSAGVMFAAVQRIVTARWSRAVIRIVEAFVAFLPVAFVMLLITVLAGKAHIFEWVHAPPTIPEKAAWLNPTLWSIRTLLVFAIITALSVWFVFTSVRLDVGVVPEWGANWARGIRDRMRANFGDERRELHTTHSIQGKIAVFLGFAFVFGWVVLSWDLSMAVDPHFQSTMYGWQFFVGGLLNMMMIFALLARFWRRQLAADHLITATHFHDIGKLCFALTAFWGYVTFGQLLVIWYGNIAEETHFFRKALIDPYTPLTVSVVLLGFAFPFFGLLGKFPKLFTPTMAFFAACSLIGLWLHRYLEIYPANHPAGGALPLGIWEIGIFLGYLGIWGFCYLSFMDAFPRMRVFLMTSPHRDEVQVPVDPKTMEPLPAHE